MSSSWLLPRVLVTYLPFIGWRACVGWRVMRLQPRGVYPPEAMVHSPIV